MTNTTNLRAGTSVIVHESDAPEYTATVLEVQLNEQVGPDGPYTDPLVRIQGRNGRSYWVREARIVGLA